MNDILQCVPQSMIEPVKDMYAKYMGRFIEHLHKQRLRNIIETLLKWNLTPDEVKIEDHRDFCWDKRCNRKSLERLAVVIGNRNSDKHGWTINRWWMIPLVPPREA